MMRTYTTIIAAILFVAPAAFAVPCGDVPQEGKCQGNTPVYCNSQGELEEGKACEGCCGWNGKKFDCLACPPEQDCVANGCPCFPECNTPDVFGCNLQNTHEWTCEVDSSGCVRRVFVPCSTGEICNEEGNHKCTDLDNVDLCGGVPADGVCDGEIHKLCKDNKIVQTDCAALGKACLKSGCGECPFECNSGETGCLPTGEQWTCTENPLTGCNVKAAKKCGVKKCIDGMCQYPPTTGSDSTDVADDADASSEIADGADDSTSAGATSATDATPAPKKSGTDSGGCMVTRGPQGIPEGVLVLLMVLAGFAMLTRHGETRP